MITNFEIPVRHSSQVLLSLTTMSNPSQNKSRISYVHSPTIFGYHIVIIISSSSSFICS